MDAPEFNPTFAGHEPTIASRDELRRLIAELRINCTNGDFRHGNSQTVAASPHWNRKTSNLHVDLVCRPLGSALIHPGGTKVSLQWHAGIVSSMPVGREFDHQGRVQFEIPIPREMALDATCRFRAPLSSVKLYQHLGGIAQLPTLKPAALAANDSGEVFRGWNPVEGFPSTMSCASDDGRVTAFATYRGANVVLHFQAPGECAGKSVWWATGTPGKLLRQGTEVLGPEEDHQCATRDVEIPLPSELQEVYFELTDSV